MDDWESSVYQLFMLISLKQLFPKSRVLWGLNGSEDPAGFHGGPNVKDQNNFKAFE